MTAKKKKKTVRKKLRYPRPRKPDVFHYSFREMLSMSHTFADSILEHHLKDLSDLEKQKWVFAIQETFSTLGEKYDFPAVEAGLLLFHTGIELLCECQTEKDEEEEPQ